MPSKTETAHDTFINSFESRKEEKPNHAEGSLRDELLSASETRGNFVFIPMGTVAVEGNSHTLTTESFFENSDNVAKLRENPNYLTNHVEGSATRLRGGRHMSSLNREFHNRQETEPNGNNLTFLYDEKAKVAENELHIPSAVLVHETLSEEEIARLRETLPPEVPMVDAKTNELLDQVGQEQREQRRERRRAEFDLGFIALAQMLQKGRYVRPDLSGFMKSHRSFRVPEGGVPEEFFHDPLYEGMVSNNTADARTRREAADGYAYDRWGGSGSQSTYDTKPKTEAPREEKVRETPDSNIPESDEVRAHREEQEAKAKLEEEMRANGERYARVREEYGREVLREKMDKRRLVDEMAQEKLGKSVYDLDDSELKSFYKRTSRELHPDAPETGDADRFRTLHDVVKDIQEERSQEASSGSASESGAEPESKFES